MDEQVSQNRRNLEKLNEEFGDFHVSFKIGRKWELYSETIDKWTFLPINHREVFPQEIVFDFDLNNQEKLTYYYKRIVVKLKKHNLKFYAFTTGGKGIHIHILFPEILKHDIKDRPLLKKSIIDYFFRDSKGNSFSHLAKVDYQLCSRHLVRAEFGLHEKTRKYKEPLYEFTPLIKEDNKIPSGALELFKEELKPKKSRKGILSSTGIKQVAFPCIQYLLSQDFAGNNDGRKRALIMLCSYFYSNLGKKGFSIIVEWNDYKLNGYFSEEQLNSKWDSMKKMVDGGKRFGCTSMKYLLNEFGRQIEVCEKCVLYN